MIAIVTDSSVGYSTEEISSRGILSVVPLNYQLGPNFYEEYASDRNGNYMQMMQQLKAERLVSQCQHSLWNVGTEMVLIWKNSLKQLDMM